MAVALALLSSLLWGTADFFGGIFTKRMPAVVVVLISQMIALALIVPTVWLIGSFDDPSGYFWWGVGAGIVGPVGLVSFYRALSIGTMGVVSPIAATGIIVPVAWGLAQGEQPSVLQFIGIAMAFVGVVLAGRPGRAARECRGARCPREVNRACPGGCTRLRRCLRVSGWRR